MTMPDFETWAVSLWSDLGPKCTEVTTALQQAFEQGRALGRREMLENPYEGYESANQDTYNENF